MSFGNDSGRIIDPIEPKQPIAEPVYSYAIAELNVRAYWLKIGTLNVH